ncbi:Hypothetical predicted protein [Marmota monax]|uniref:Uncharacterized protein n=1 Tax=Marmota monax TaxID=9995 RepID=A0A5E4A5H1_MARMO|nr:Hypothetical predicted protein [Marmota monax]
MTPHNREDERVFRRESEIVGPKSYDPGCDLKSSSLTAQGLSVRTPAEEKPEGERRANWNCSEDFTSFT